MAGQAARDIVVGFAAGYNRYLKDLKAGTSKSHAACRNEVWVTNITTTDIYRRMYEANLAGGYSNFVANIANAAAPAARGRPPDPTRQNARRHAHAR